MTADTNTKYDLYARLEKRAFDYPKALGPSGDSSWLQTIIQHWVYFKEKLKSLDSQYDLFGKGFWGYGLNRICDGKTSVESLDVVEVERLNKQNKHHDHGIIHLMIFKIKADDFIYHTFSFNLLNLKWVSNLSQKMSLTSITNVKTRISNQIYFVEIESSVLPLTMSFQVESYYAHNTSPETISSYYVKEITRFIEIAKSRHVTKVVPTAAEEVRLGSLKDISFDYELSFFTDEKRIPNQDLVNETINHFKSGPGARIFTPVEFLNLFEKQYNFLKMNYNDGEKVIAEFNGLPLNDLEKHVLYGFLLKWFGGYPVHNLNEELNITLKKVQNEFLNYSETTPEKEFCKADQSLRNKMMKMGIALTTAINTGVDARLLMAEIDDEESDEAFNSFDSLFEAAASNGALGEFKDKLDYFTKRTKVHFDFNIWLQELKHWHYGDDDQYKRHLKKSTFIEFMQYWTAKEKELSAKKQNEKKSWIAAEIKTENNSSKRHFNISSTTLRQLLEILRGFFNADQQILLQTLLESGLTSEKLIFLDSGNRLADAFKQLSQADLIPGYTKKELQNWIRLNFSYKSRLGIKDFTADYLEKCISRNYSICKRPLFSISGSNLIKGAEQSSKKGANFRKN